ncbi:hypothetical protein T484DRAFT_3646921, partial [Baffinella frigidus]
SPTPETQNPKPETRNPKPETRNPKPEARNPKPETRNPKPETRNPKPETRSPKQTLEAVEFPPFPVPEQPRDWLASTEVCCSCQPSIHSLKPQPRNPRPKPRTRVSAVFGPGAAPRLARIHRGMLCIPAVPKPETLNLKP